MTAGEGEWLGEVMLADLAADKDNSGVTARIANDGDMDVLTGFFPGPPDTPYAGGTYEVRIVIPPTYPFKPPDFQLKTKIWHPNISSVTVRARTKERELTLRL